MILVSIKCPYCGSEDIVKNGISKSGVQVYMCRNVECSRTTFQEKYTYNAYKPKIKEQIFDLTVNGNGTRAIGRILGISNNTVTSTLKKKEEVISNINIDYIERNKEDIIGIVLVRVEAVEMDEQWSFVHDKSQQYWLWWVIDHNTGEPLAYVFGTREHANLDELRKKLNMIFEIKYVYVDGNPAYQNISESEVVVGKRNTQKIENKHLSLRTWCSRLVRKGLRFSKSHLMHRIVVGLIINFWFFNCKLW